MDHSIGALTDPRYADISDVRLEEQEHDRPDIRHANWWHSMTAVAIQREWTTDIWQRTAIERLGHLFCELILRLQAVGLTDGRSCDVPATRTNLTDATGLTPVHVSRTSREMRERSLIALRNRRLAIPDPPAFEATALFSPTHLHLGIGEPSHPFPDGASWTS